MIESREDLKKYLTEDTKANQRKRLDQSFFGDEI